MQLNLLWEVAMQSIEENNVQWGCAMGTFLFAHFCAKGTDLWTKNKNK